jgi:DNA-binding MarR family transcriptional regulator
LKAKEYTEGGVAVQPAGHPLDDDLQELVQLFAQVVQSQKRGSGHPPQWFVEAFERHSLGPRHVRVLISLTFRDALSVSELASRIGLSLGTTSLMVGELSRAGLVERSEDERDRRRTIVRLHGDYVDTMKTLTRERTEPMRRALERMAPADRETFMQGWRMLAEETVGTAEGEGADEDG